MAGRGAARDAPPSPEGGHSADATKTLSLPPLRSPPGSAGRSTAGGCLKGALAAFGRRGAHRSPRRAPRPRSGWGCRRRFTACSSKSQGPRRRRVEETRGGGGPGSATPSPVPGCGTSPRVYWTRAAAALALCCANRRLGLLEICTSTLSGARCCGLQGALKLGLARPGLGPLRPVLRPGHAHYTPTTLRARPLRPALRPNHTLHAPGSSRPGRPPYSTWAPRKRMA